MVILWCTNQTYHSMMAVVPREYSMGKYLPSRYVHTWRYVLVVSLKSRASEAVDPAGTCTGEVQVHVQAGAGASPGASAGVQGKSGGILPISPPVRPPGTPPSNHGHPGRLSFSLKFSLLRLPLTPPPLFFLNSTITIASPIQQIRTNAHHLLHHNRTHPVPPY